MINAPPQRLSQIAVGVLLLIVVRCLGEVFRLQYVHGASVSIAEVMPYIGAALATAIFLAAALIGHACGYYRSVVSGAVVSVIALLIYKIAFMS
jgi:hypothetical protein